MPPLRPCNEAGKKNVLLLLKSQADEAFSNKAFMFFIFTISLRLKKEVIDVELIVSPFTLEPKILHKFCICSFPVEISIR